MSVLEEERNAVAVLPFAIEADHPRMSDLLLQGIPNCRLRSAISGVKPVIDVKTGHEVLPRDQAIHLGSFPNTPGMQVHVNPAECTYEIIDPLRDNAVLLERIRRFMQENSGIRTSDRFNGVETQKGTLDPHRMKTLCRELLFLVNSGEAKKVKGPMPTLRDIDELPGNYLLNPGARVPVTQPMYEKDFPAWVDKLSQSGM